MYKYGYALRQTLQPLGGQGTPVQPPSYDGGEFAVSETPNGKTVVLNSVPAEAHNASETMYEALATITNPPGIYVENPQPETIKELAEKKYKKQTNTNGVDLDTFLDIAVDTISTANITSWTASHRHVDAIIRYSIDPETGKQIWESDTTTGNLLRTAGNGRKLAENFPNSAILGYWLSARSPMPSKLARSLRSEVVGHGAQEVRSGTTKLGHLAGLKSDKLLALHEGAAQLLDKETKNTYKPSELGLGAIPGAIITTGYRCDTIERNATLSTRSLATRLLNVDNDMTELLTALGLIGLLGESTLYRSACDLVVTNTELFTIGTHGQRKPIDPDKAYEQAMNVLHEKSNLFSDPIHVHMSPLIINLTLKMLLDNMTKN